jgi:G3E family GTPase
VAGDYLAMKEIPVHIISGFLGAGKTTLMLQLLDKKPPQEHWAIVINEFGKISIDGATLQSKSAGGSLYEIVGGCICCSAKAYFGENLDKIVQENRYHRILIEPSGLGGIDHITELVGQHPELRLLPVVCLVDMAMTKHPRLRMLPIFKAQVLKSDLVMFTKTELMGEQELLTLKEQFAADFPGKIYVNREEAENFFLGKSMGISLAGNNLSPAFFLAETAGKEDYKGFSLKLSADMVIHPTWLSQLLALEPAIVRAKGYIYTGNEWLLFNYTLTGTSTESCSLKLGNELVVIYDATLDFDSQLFKFKVEDIAIANCQVK